MLFRFFKRKPVKFLGRGGVVYRYNDVDYLVDSEMSFNSDIDMVIFSDTIQTKDNNMSLSNDQKRQVLESLVTYLSEKEKMKVKLFPK